MTSHQLCNGVRRRDFLRAGALGGLSLTLGDFLRIQAQAAPATRAEHMIFVNLNGGPSHMDTFDLKPKAKAEHKGEFNPIDTNVPGMQISEHLPKLAKCADKYSILRGVSHSFAAHELGTRYMNSGNIPITTLQFPSFGAVVTKEKPTLPDLPPFVAVPATPQTSGYLGIEYAPMQTNAVPQIGKPFSVRGVTLGNGVTVTDLERRESLLQDLDKAFTGYEKQNPLLSGLDRFAEQAHRILTSSRTREAFNIDKEAEPLRQEFGNNPFGQSCLLALRLIEAGVRVTTVSFGGWDTHADNFKLLKEQRLPQLDAGLAGLFNNLEKRGLLSKTLVCVTGEFGRTPKINPKAGRDHWSRAMFMVLAGGGIKGGRVVGASDDEGMGPKEKGFKPDDVAATLYHQLGIDHHREYHTAIGRPVMVVRDGNILPEIIS